MDADWLVPDWPAPSPVRALCTTRAGGVSAAPYDALNLGDHVGDALADVLANRDRLAGAMAAQPVFLHQVHGRVAAHLTGLTLASVVAVSVTGRPAGSLPVRITVVPGIGSSPGSWMPLSLRSSYTLPAIDDSGPTGGVTAPTIPASMVGSFCPATRTTASVNPLALALLSLAAVEPAAFFVVKVEPVGRVVGSNRTVYDPGVRLVNA